jgi:hypothetical protein
MKTTLVVGAIAVAVVSVAAAMIYAGQKAHELTTTRGELASARHAVGQAQLRGFDHGLAQGQDAGFHQAYEAVLPQTYTAPWQAGTWYAVRLREKGGYLRVWDRHTLDRTGSLAYYVNGETIYNVRRPTNSSSSQTASCTPITASDGISCTEAQTLYAAFVDGTIDPSWGCSGTAASGTCSNLNEVSSDAYASFSWGRA